LHTGSPAGFFSSYFRKRLSIFTLSQLAPEVTRGKTLRQRMAGGGVKIQGPAFYQLMERIEELGWVKGTHLRPVERGISPGSVRRAFTQFHAV
jgi:hypothetical protein